MQEPGRGRKVTQCNFTLAAADGTELFVHRWLPDEPAKAAVQIVHGLAEHGARYARLAAALNEHGYAVYANDHRGHGKTAKSLEQLGFFAERDGWRKCLDDLWLLHQRIAADHPALPMILLGHSMGSTMARQFIMEHGDALAGAVLSGPSGQPTAMAAVGRVMTRVERFRLGPRGHSRIIGDLTFDGFNKAFAPARTPFDWLSRDPAEWTSTSPICSADFRPASSFGWKCSLPGRKSLLALHAGESLGIFPCMSSPGNTIRSAARPGKLNR